MKRLIGLSILFLLFVNISCARKHFEIKSPSRNLVAKIAMEDSCLKLTLFDSNIPLVTANLGRFVFDNNESWNAYHIKGVKQTFKDEEWVTEKAQGTYKKENISEINIACERPLVIRKNDTSFLALGEAALVDFARMKFIKDPANPLSLQVTLDGDVDLDKAAYITPWRYIMVAESPGELLENNFFILNLNEPNKLEDDSWIIPGKVIREVTLTTQGGMACIDFAAKHNLQYVDPKRSPGPLDLQKIIEYENIKEIGIILYVNRRTMEKQLDDILPLYKSWGIKGLKYGFVNVGTQEGIRGDEESPSTEHTLVTLFTRMIAGAGDNTNCYFAPRIPEKMGGKIGEYATIVRKSEDTWFLGTLTSGQPRQVVIPLTFLDEEEDYEIVIYCQNAEDLETDRVRIKSIYANQKTVLSKDLLENSGFAAVIRKKWIVQCVFELFLIPEREVYLLSLCRFLVNCRLGYLVDINIIKTEDNL